MGTKVIMILSDDELALVKQLRESLSMTTNTGTIGQSLRIAAFIADGVKRGKQVAFLDADGEPETKINIPGLTE